MHPRIKKRYGDLIGVTHQSRMSNVAFPLGHLYSDFEIKYNHTITQAKPAAVNRYTGSTS
jgi:hypothetical protein